MRIFSNKILLSSFKALLGAALMYWLLHRGDIDFDFLWQRESLLPLMALTLIQLLISAASTWRWHLFLQRLSVNVSFRTCLYVNWTSQFFSSFLPNFVAADIARGLQLTRTGQRTGAVATSIFFDRLAATVTIVGLALMSVGFYLLHFAPWVYVAVLFGFLIGVARLLSRTWSQSLALSLFTFHLKVASLMVIAYQWVGLEISWDWFWLSMAGQFFESLPLTPGNMGVGHMAFQTLYSLRHFDQGAQVYNIYFTIKMLFKVSGLIPWVFVGLQKRELVYSGAK